MVAHCDIQSPRPPNGSQPWVWYMVWPKLSISQDLPVTKETSVSLAIAWIHVQKLIHVQKTILFLLLSANHESLSLC